MLLRAMLLIAFIAAIGETMIVGAAALGRTAFHSREMQMVRNGFASAIQSAQSAIAAGGSPEPLSTCAASDPSGCTLKLQATVSRATPAPQATGTCADERCAIALQANASVAESRQTYDIAVTLVATNGDPVVSRHGTVAFRTFNVPPYASLVSSLDATLDTLMNGGVGDDGGSISQAHATLIHVDYRPANGGADVPADTWRTLHEQSATVFSGWER